MIEKHLKQLQVEMELAEPFPNDVPGTWSIPLDTNLAVTLTELKPEGFSLYCILGPYPKYDEEDFLNQLMLSNLFGQGTSGAVLGIDEDQKNIVLVLHMEYDVDYQQFKDTLEDFVSSVDVWRDELLEHQKEK